MKKYNNEWTVQGNLNETGFEFTDFILNTIKEKLPEYFEFLPFKNAWNFEVFIEDNLYCVRIEDMVGTIPQMGKTISNPTLITTYKNIFASDNYPGFDFCNNLLQENGYKFDLFTYVGKVEGHKLCWQHITQVIVEWLNKIVIPEILKMNTKRVTDAIPIPPSFDVPQLLDNIYVIESETGMKQGTAFHLEGFGLITCDHCVRDESTNEILADLVIFKGNNHSRKFPVKIIKTNQDLDLAYIETSKELLSSGLKLGSSDNLNQLDHIGVAGFPNYNFGDNGIFSPGLIVGFRTFSGIRHILINSPLISGNSGGPAFDKNSKVIGIAVTGADKMSSAHETEKHGLIPIEAINFLK